MVRVLANLHVVIQILIRFLYLSGSHLQHLNLIGGILKALAKIIDFTLTVFVSATSSVWSSLVATLRRHYAQTATLPGWLWHKSLAERSVHKVIVDVIAVAVNLLGVLVHDLRLHLGFVENVDSTGRIVSQLRNSRVHWIHIAAASLVQVVRHVGHLVRLQGHTASGGTPLLLLVLVPLLLLLSDE